MIRTSIVSLVSCGLLVAAVGCGDDTGSGGAGGSGTTSSTTGATTSGGTTTSTTTATTTTATTTTGGGAATCAAYCTAISAACTGNSAQYTTEVACNSECAAFMQGSPGDMGMNTLECRAYHASVANNDMHCQHAGPLGGGSVAGNGCGMMRCSSFCQVAAEICPAAFTNGTTCAAECAAYTDNVDFSTAETAGNTLACRMYHLSVASQSAGDAATHCAHIETLGSPCSN